MRHWLDVCFTEGGLMVAQQKLHKRPLLVSIHLHKISSLWLIESKDLVFDCKQANILQRQLIVHIFFNNSGQSNAGRMAQSLSAVSMPKITVTDAS